MLTVVLAGMRARWASLVGGFTALALGVGLVAVMGLGLSATLNAPERAPVRFASAPVVVQGHDRLAVEVRRGPGKAVATAPLDRPQPVDDELLRELRARWSVTTADPGSRSGHPSHDGSSHPSDDGSGHPSDNGSRSGAAGAAGVPGPDAVGVDAPAAEVRALVGDRARVLTGAERRAVDPEAARDARALVALNALLGTAGGVAAFVSVFVVASTFAFAVALRRREYGLLRTAGATPGQVRRMLLAEAAGLGVLASAVGCLLGAWGAPLLARALVDGGVAPSWFTIGTGGAPGQPFHAAHWIAFGTGVTVALAGAVAASRRAGRVGPTAALREADVDTDVLPRGRALCGAALLLAGIGLLAWTGATDPSTLLKRKTYTTQPMLLISGVALLAPLLVRPAARALRLPGAVGTLVRENSAAAVRRTAAVAAPVLVTVALAGTLLGSAATVTAAKAAEARGQTTAAYVTTGRDLPRTGTATGATSVFVRDGAEALVKYGARAVADPAAWASSARLPVVAGDLRNLDDGSIVVNEEFERRTVGEGVEVWLADGSGPVRLRVAAVLARGTGDNGPYVTWANAPDATADRIDGTGPPGEGSGTGHAHKGGTGADRPGTSAAGGAGGAGGAGPAGGPGAHRTGAGAAVAVTSTAPPTTEQTPAPGSAPAPDSTSASTSTSAPGPGPAGGVTRTVDDWAAATHPAMTPQTRLGLLLVLGIALVYTVIALVNTLLMATSVRGPELVALRLAGATRAQVLRVVVGESLLAVGIGTVLGLGVTAVCLGGLGAGLAALSAPVALTVPWGTVGAAAGVCAAVAAAASLLPAWRLTR
ncbi:FtsX-like permease family protein [Streptomyces roseoviridis]|uniref:FtsX-like permease family protein n=1 Tax=Streptomyces roseoviridis TaxID=67361 RepID=A0ABV5QM52_9ACTN